MIISSIKASPCDPPPGATMEDFLPGPHNVSWSNCTNATRANPLKRNDEVAKAEVAVLVLVLLLALGGNLSVLWAVHAAKQRQSRMLYFMWHLSIADLVVAVFQVLPQLIWDITFRFYGPDVLCRLIKYSQVVGMFASTYMLVLMSIDRCLAICQPLRPAHTTRDRICVGMSWLLSLIFSTPQVYIFSLQDVGDGVYDCWGDFVQPWGAKAYVTWMSLSIYILPMGVLSVCYGLICLKIWQNFNLKTRREHFLARAPKDAHHLCRVSSVRLISKAKIRTVKMTFVVVLAYVLCWTPFFFVQMWSAWDPAAPREDAAFIIAMLLASLNSCCNPWIYMFFAGHMFQGVTRGFVFCCCSCSRFLSASSGSRHHNINTSSKQRSSAHTSSTHKDAT
ncbi:isotocin receptor-like [Nerophis ophidion]|uniref:isotocin receptor-like n=1 Tax=Nerophis ophidion TaxID=159077 RepID=UPI002ADF16F2|nr:isotocin receptor-like [Nerophis ophidion]XP_061731205.1 isotocin receptor-like [Nerophis ophidion]XP_061731206.1 isotocin receptor-like [Nerophis ophidion]XP_061731207.1 isotocin receptor-like [Nerophis ophidion]